MFDVDLFVKHLSLIQMESQKNTCEKVQLIYGLPREEFLQFKKSLFEAMPMKRQLYTSSDLRGTKSVEFCGFLIKEVEIF